MTISAAPVHLSLGTWAAALGVSRDVFRRVLSEAGTAPAGKKSGHPVYAVADVVQAWVQHLTGSETPDPDTLPPFQRKAHYQAEHEKMNLETERGHLVPDIEVERGEAEIFKILTQFADTLPDVLERDAGLSPLQLTRVEKHLSELREALYLRLIDADADSAIQDRA